MKLAALIIFMFSTVVLAHDCPPDVSRTCFNSMPRTMQYSLKVKNCHNVADTCFYHFYRKIGAGDAIKLCKNTAASCYQDLSRTLKPSWENRLVARNKCFDIPNDCYRGFRRARYPIAESILLCSGSTHQCQMSCPH